MTSKSVTIGSVVSVLCRVGFLFLVSQALWLGPPAMAQEEVVLDFDDEGPLLEGELLEWFDFYGFDPTVGANWTVEPNFVNPDDSSNALRTTSEGERLQEYFSRVAILRPDVFEGENVEFSVDITWDDNDNCGVYVRFRGDSDDPLGNEYYYVRVDIDDGPPSSVYLYRVKDRVPELLIQATDDPLPISPGETHTVTVTTRGEEISVAVDGIDVTGMDPFVDPDPLLGCGRVGVGHNTNPSYYDNFIIARDDTAPCACRAIRSLSTSRFVPGGTVSVTVNATNIRGATTITETFPATWEVMDTGGGVVAGNTIAFEVSADGEVRYALRVPEGFCGPVDLSGEIEGAGGCSAEVDGQTRLTCVEVPAGARVLDFENDGPAANGELLDWFDFYGFAPVVGANWTVEANGVNAENPSRALRTTSEGEQLEEYFSRVAILRSDVFEGENVEFSVDITWDDNDNCGVYVRFNGDSDDPLGNEYYYVRIDIDDGPPSSVYLYRVREGVADLLIQATDDPFAIVPGQTHTVTVAAREDELTVAIDGREVRGMDPFVDPDPLLGCGRVGVGHNTNPSYYDNFVLAADDASTCSCAASRSLSTGRFAPGETVRATVSARNVRGATTITESFPATWRVTDAGSGAVAGNTITFDVDADGEVSYELTVPGDFCEEVELTGEIEGAGGCSADVGGDSELICLGIPAERSVLDFDDEGPLSDGELPDWFDFYGFDPTIGTNWTVEPNFVNADDPSSALHTVSEGERLEEYFSRVAILKADVFEAENVYCAVDITWDDNDNCGVYLRFNGESDVPLENEYYYVRVDIDDGPPSSVYIYRVRGGAADLLVQAVDDPFPISPGETHTVEVVAREDALFIALDGLPVSNMNPFIDPDPLEGAGRVGVGHNTNPSYYDNFEFADLDEFRPGPTGPVFVRGDTDGDGGANLTDAVLVLNHLFGGGAAPGCMKSADVNDTGSVDIADPVFLLNHLFGTGPEPGPPWLKCGTDPTQDELTCATFARCE